MKGILLLIFMSFSIFAQGHMPIKLQNFILDSEDLAPAVEYNYCTFNSGLPKKIEKLPEYFIDKGTIKYLKLTYPSQVLNPSKMILMCGHIGNMDEVEVPFFYLKKQQKISIFIEESYYSDLKPKRCYLTNGVESFDIALIKVINKKYPVSPSKSRLKVKDASGIVTKRAPEIEQKIKEDRAAFRAAYKNSPKYPLFTESFEVPLKSVTTSPYGLVRQYKDGSFKGRHSGVDLRARTPQELPASNDGIVVLAKDTYFTGKSISVDHGLGIYTVYLHLSQMDVKPGDKVKKGQILGLTGGTGAQVTGPHLHWGVKMDGRLTDPYSLIEASKEFEKDIE